MRCGTWRALVWRSSARKPGRPDGRCYGPIAFYERHGGIVLHQVRRLPDAYDDAGSGPIRFQRI